VPALRPWGLIKRTVDAENILSLLAQPKPGPPDYFLYISRFLFNQHKSPSKFGRGRPNCANPGKGVQNHVFQKGIVGYDLDCQLFREYGRVFFIVRRFYAPDVGGLVTIGCRSCLASCNY